MIGLGLFGMGLVGMGCAVDPTGGEADPDDVELGAAMQGTGGDPGSLNHLLPRCLNDHGVQYAVRNMGNARLSGLYTDYLPAMANMPAGNATGDLAGCRRTFLEILVGCALPAGALVKDPNDMVYVLGGYVPRMYFGEVGLVPEWESRALSTDEKELITACVMARTNRFGETISILLEGADPAIAYNADSRALYPYAESTVWGNMFDSTVPLTPDGQTYLPQPFAGYVCRNYGTGLCPDAAFRACDDGNNCGFIDKGDCMNPSIICSGVLGTPPSSCDAWSNRIEAFLQTTEEVCPIEYGDYAPL